MKKDFITDYDIDLILEEVENQLLEQNRRGQGLSIDSGQIQQFFKDILKKPAGGSMLADILRGSYSLAGTDDEIAPLDVTDLRLHDVFLETIALSIRGAVLATNPSAQLFTLLRLMWDTPAPKTATELVTRIINIWGEAGGRIVKDIVTRVVRGVHYSITKVAAPLLAPLVGSLALGSLAEALPLQRHGKLGDGGFVNSLQNPTKTNEILAIKNYDIGQKALHLKSIAQKDEDDLFVAIAKEILEYVQKYGQLLKEGLKIWGERGDDFDFANRTLQTWNDTVGNSIPEISINTFENLERLKVYLERSKRPLDKKIKEKIADFFASLEFPGDGEETVYAASAGNSQIPLPLYKGKSPSIITNNGIKDYKWNSFFDQNKVNNVYWNWLNNDSVKSVWSKIVNSSPDSFFENDEFNSKIAGDKSTVFQLIPELKQWYILRGRKYFEDTYGSEEVAKKFERFQRALAQNPVKPEQEKEKQEPESEAGEEDTSQDPMLKSFEEGTVSNKKFTKPVNEYLKLSKLFAKQVPDDFVLTDHIVSKADKILEKIPADENYAGIFKKAAEGGANPNIVKQFVSEFISPIKQDVNLVIKELATESQVISVAPINLPENVQKWPSEYQRKYINLVLFGYADMSEKDMEMLFHSIYMYMAFKMLKKVEDQMMNLGDSEMINFLKSLDAHAAKVRSDNIEKRGTEEEEEEMLNPNRN